MSSHKGVELFVPFSTSPHGEAQYGYAGFVSDISLLVRSSTTMLLMTVLPRDAEV